MMMLMTMLVSHSAGNEILSQSVNKKITLLALPVGRAVQTLIIKPEFRGTGGRREGRELFISEGDLMGSCGVGEGSEGGRRERGKGQFSLALSCPPQTSTSPTAQARKLSHPTTPPRPLSLPSTRPHHTLLSLSTILSLPLSFSLPPILSLISRPALTPSISHSSTSLFARDHPGHGDRSRTDECSRTHRQTTLQQARVLTKAHQTVITRTFAIHRPTCRPGSGQSRD